MGKTRKPRSDARMYQLPKAVLDEVNDRLLRRNASYTSILQWLEQQGHKISASSLSKYAIKLFDSAQDVANDMERTRNIIEFVGKNPDLDITTATTAILKSGLLKKISNAQDEFSEIPLEKAGHLFVQLSKAESIRQQAEFAMRSKMELAWSQMESELMACIAQHPELATRLHTLLEDTREAVFSDDD